VVAGSRRVRARTLCPDRRRNGGDAGLYQEGDFDLAGTIVGIVERDQIIDGSRITPGDVIFALPSNGLHTNGYSLARRDRLRCDEAGR
jgi:phosphoribosylaminoimidazole (AIR) synthetase